MSKYLTDLTYNKRSLNLILKIAASLLHVCTIHEQPRKETECCRALAYIRPSNRAGGSHASRESHVLSDLRQGHHWLTLAGGGGSAPRSSLVDLGGGEGVEAQVLL